MIIRSISLEKKLNEEIRFYCKNNGMTVSGLISVLLTKHLLSGANAKVHEINGIEVKKNMPRSEV